MTLVQILRIAPIPEQQKSSQKSSVNSHKSGYNPIQRLWMKLGISRVVKQLMANKQGFLYLSTVLIVIGIKNMWILMPSTNTINIFGFTYEVAYYESFNIFIWSISDSLSVLVVILLFLVNFVNKVESFSIGSFYRNPYNLQIVALIGLFIYYFYDLIIRIPSVNINENFYIDVSAIVIFLAISGLILWGLNKRFEHNYYHGLKAAIASLKGLQQIRKERDDIDDLLDKEVEKLSESIKKLYD